MVTLDQAGWCRTALVLSPPPAALAGLIEFVSIDTRSARGRPWRIVADDAAHLIYCRFLDGHGREAHRLSVVGARPAFVDDTNRSRRAFTIAVRLRPGVLPALFGVPAHELTGRSVPAAFLVREVARDALARLEDATPTDAMHCVAGFVTACAARGRPVDARARWLGCATEGEIGSVRHIAEHLVLGERGVRAWSATHLGLGARRWLSIRRLHRAMELRLTQPAVAWSRVAALAGFADQSHLVRDCRALLGEAPSAFAARATG